MEEHPGAQRVSPSFSPLSGNWNCSQSSMGVPSIMPLGSSGIHMILHSNPEESVIDDISPRDFMDLVH